MSATKQIFLVTFFDLTLVDHFALNKNVCLQAQVYWSKCYLTKRAVGCRDDFGFSYSIIELFERTRGLSHKSAKVNFKYCINDTKPLP